MDALFSFEGRVNRATYAYLCLGSIVVAFVLGFVDGATGQVSESGFGLLSSIWALAAVIPGFAITVKRFHDFGWSGWSVLLLLIPLAGLLCLVMLFFRPGTTGKNQHGEKPGPGFSLAPAY